MASNPEGLTRWNTLRGAWLESNAKARQARLLLTKNYADWAEGKAHQPGIEQIDEVQRLEHVADQLSIEMDQLVRNLLR